jgi:hypothetical protein
VVEAQTQYTSALGSTVAAGAPRLSADGYLPGPSGGAHEYAMLLNPGTYPVQATLTGLDATGRAVAVQRLTLPAGGQARIDLARGAMGARQLLHLHASAPIAIGYVGLLGPSGEQSLAQVYRGSATSGLEQPARVISYAEGDTRQTTSAPHETLLIANPGAARTHVYLTIYSAGAAPVTRLLELQPGGSGRLDLNGLVPPGEHGVILRSGQPILAWHGIDLNEGAIRLLSPGYPG